MSIKIGKIDIAQSIIELEFQTKLNAYLIEILWKNRRLTPPELEDLKNQVINEINKKYGEEVLKKKQV